MLQLISDYSIVFVSCVYVVEKIEKFHSHGTAWIFELVKIASASKNTWRKIPLKIRNSISDLLWFAYFDHVWCFICAIWNISKKKLTIDNCIW